MSAPRTRATRCTPRSRNSAASSAPTPSSAGVRVTRSTVATDAVDASVWNDCCTTDATRPPRRAHPRPRRTSAPRSRWSADQPLASSSISASPVDAAARLGTSCSQHTRGWPTRASRPGTTSRVATALAELVRAHPLRERFHAQLILALYRGGRQAEARCAPTRTPRTVLVEEFGVEPGPELQELERAVLAHDPALALTPSAVAPPARWSPAPPTTPPSSSVAIPVRPAAARAGCR